MPSCRSPAIARCCAFWGWSLMPQSSVRWTPLSYPCRDRCGSCKSITPLSSRPPTLLHFCRHYSRIWSRLRCRTEHRPAATSTSGTTCIGGCRATSRSGWELWFAGLMYIEERAGTCTCGVHVATELLKSLLRKDSHHEMVLATMGEVAQGSSQI